MSDLQDKFERDLRNRFEGLLQLEKELDAMASTAQYVMRALGKMGAVPQLESFRPQHGTIDGMRVEAVKFLCKIGDASLHGLFEPETWIVYLGEQEKNVSDYS